MTRTSSVSRPHPYIPNAVPEAKAGMLAALGISSASDLYAAIPDRLRLHRPLDLPPALTSEADLVRHVERVGARNVSTREAISFLGAGCYEHHVPAVCDEIAGRSEFLTAYAGEPYEDHGRFQALFEYASMMGELLEMDVVNVPTYDGYQAAATSLRMAARVTGRRRLVVAGVLGADKGSKIRGYVAPDLDLVEIGFDPRTGRCDLDRLAGALGPDVAAVYLENPNYLGVVETQAVQAIRLAHEVGALAVLSVDPATLGVLAPPAALGADIACGDIQSLGMHQHFGGGQAGFIATADDPRLVMEFPSRLFGVAPTRVDGEYGFGDVAYERTSFAIREEGKEWVGTAAALWGITAGVYLALLGPQGMAELGEGMLVRTRYAMAKLAAIPGVVIPFSASLHVHEFVVDFSATGRTVAEINRQLLGAGIFGGADLSAAFPSLGQSALYAVTEVRTRQDIDHLANTLTEVLA